MPEPESATEVTIRREDEDGLVTLVFDDPAQSANTMRRAHVESFEAALEELEGERDQIAGVILASAKRSFFAGGDLNELLAVEDTGFGANVAQTTDQLRRLETLGPPVVAAIGGSALGGGLEITLAAHHRIAVDDERIQLGFPEVTLGLLPGGGGVARSVRMLGISAALSELLLDGRRITPRQALDLGLVDALVDFPEELLAAAKAWIAGATGARQPWDRPGYRMPGGGPDEPRMASLLPSISAGLSARTRGSRPPAPEAIVAAAVEGAQVDFDSAVAVERRYFLSLVTGKVAKNMIGAFFFDLQEVSRATRPECPPALPASLDRGSAESILAAVLADPAAIETVSLHVPTPTEETSVLEILVGPHTSEADLQRAYSLARILGRTAIVVAAAGGPLCPRLLGALEDAVEAMLAAGLPPASVRQAAGQAGFTGPAWRRVWEITGAVDRTPASGGWKPADLEELKRGLTAAIAEEAARALEDGTVDSAAAANLASLMGVGFPSSTGGAIRLHQQGPLA